MAEMPITRAMLLGVRDELREINLKTDARIDQLSARFDQTDARIDQLGARIDQTNARVDQLSARFDQTNARIDELGARIDQTNARIDELGARIDQTNARIDELRADMNAFRAEMRAEYHRVAVLAEEQEARNRIVLEVVQGSHERFVRIESSITELRDLLHEVIDAVGKRTR